MLPGVRRGHRVAQLGAADAGGPPRPRRPRQLRHLHLHQLDPLAARTCGRGRTSTPAHGLAVVGVQTPEFDFEGDLDNVGRAIKEMDVRYPVVVDNDYAVWQAFDNHYWPALYFVDAQGQIRHHHFGEGEYEQSEMVLQMLLREAGADVEQGLVRHRPPTVSRRRPTGPASAHRRRYLGYGRAVGFASPEAVVPDERRVYSAPAALRRNQWALSGDWRIGAVPALLDEPGGSISYQFHARDLHLVMGPPPAAPTGALHGPPRRRAAGCRPTASTSTTRATAPPTTSGCTS